MITLTVNGDRVTLAAEPRTHLADLLRGELLLTGTHLGCEHGVCGACTVEVDGAPARACLLHAGSCDGAIVRTIEGFDEDTVNELRDRAKDALLTLEIAREEKVEAVSQDLRDLEGLDADLIGRLADGQVHTRDDLADLAVDELTEMTGMGEDQAKALIMKAREHWFTA